MSNRQARREQSRASRNEKQQQQQRQSRPNRPSSSGGAPRKTSSGPDFFSRPYLIGVSVLIVVLAVILTIVALNSGGSSSKLSDELTKAGAELPLDMAKGMKLGNDNAPVKIQAYEDFQCPFCLHYTAEQEPTIVNEFVKTGKVQLEYVNLPLLGTESTRAAVASVCAADQNKFWQYHNLLFLTEAKAGQGDSGGEKLNVGRFSDDNLKKYAQQVGLDTQAFSNCLADPAKLQQVQAQFQQASQFNLRSTPSFVINGQSLGAGAPASLDAWRKLINDVANAAASPTGSASATGSATGTATTPGASPSATTPAASATATKTP